jgi:DinB superfamily
MTAVELIQVELKRLRTLLDGAITGLTSAQLHAVPAGHPKANTVAWGLWHVVRTEDNVVRFVLQNRRSPVWTEGGYAEKFGLPPVAQGTGMSTEDAHALRIKDVALFREYLQKVWASTDEFLTTLEPAALDRMVTVRPIGEMAVGRVLAQVCVAHGMMHFGEIELARTLVGAPAVYGV